MNMNYEEKELTFHIVTLLLAALIGVGAAFGFYFHNQGNEDYMLWSPMVFIVILEWLNYRLWIGKRFSDSKIPKKNIAGCVITGIILLGLIGLMINLLPDDLLFVVDAVFQGVYIYAIVLLIAYFFIYDMVMK